MQMLGGAAGPGSVVETSLNLVQQRARLRAERQGFEIEFDLAFTPGQHYRIPQRS